MVMTMGIHTTARSSYGYDNGCWVYRRVYNRYGHYIGRSLVNVCQ